LSNRRVTRRPVRALRGDGGQPAEHRPGRGLGVDRVRLAAATSGRPIGPIDLDDLYARGPQVPGQRDAVRTGAFDPGLADQPMTAPPGQQRPVASGSGSERLGGHHGAEHGDHHRDVLIRVSIDPENDLPFGVGLG